MAARLSSDHWAPIVQAFGWELMKLADDAPRLLRAILRKREAEPVAVTAPIDPTIAGRWIAAAIVIGCSMITAALILN